MANAAIATPTLLTDPGFLYWAPIGSTLPTGTVVGSVFTDSWPVAWIPMGMTEAGSEFDDNATVSPIAAAESFYALAYRTTEHVASVTFMLKSFTATNLSRAFNGAALTVTGSTTTTMTAIDPVTPGNEVRCMLGYESLDSTFRWVAYQCINSGDIKLTMARVPSNTNIPWNAALEKPASTPPWKMWTAGVARG